MESCPLHPEPISQVWNKQEFNGLLLWACESGYSDVKINPNDPVWARRHGEWMRVTTRELRTAEIARLFCNLVNNQAAANSVLQADPYDFRYSIRTGPDVWQGFRGVATACSDQSERGIEVTLRVIIGTPPDTGQLGLSPEVVQAGTPNNGLVLLTGVMGSGKSTTIAALLRFINEHAARSIQTIEDPVEYILTGNPLAKGPVAQTEVGRDIKSFADGMRNVTRRASDVILLGEVRDYLTVEALLAAANLGATAYATLHTATVASTPARIINFAGTPDQQSQFATSLFSCVRFVMQQRLVPALDPKTGNPDGRVPLREYLEFDAGMREELQTLPYQKTAPVIQQYVEAHGHPLLTDARAQYEAGRIAQTEYDLVERECAAVARTYEHAHVA